MDAKTFNHNQQEESGLTPEIMKKEAEERIGLISQEFQKGFEFVNSYTTSVTFFGSARFQEEDKHYQNARNLAHRIVTELGYCVVTGGGPGIMEAANRGAYEAGGRSIGLNIELPEEQNVNPYVSEKLDFHYFFSRKVCLSFSAEAYIFFPGGFGTMDEFFEILTLVQTRKIHNTPLLLCGSEFWQPLQEFIQEELLTRGTVNEEDSFLYTITDDPDTVMEQIKNAPVKHGVRSSRSR